MVGAPFHVPSAIFAFGFDVDSENALPHRARAEFMSENKVKYPIHPVFSISAISLLFFLGISLVFPAGASKTFAAALKFVSDRFGWFYILSVSFLLGFSLWLMASRYGNIRLGDDDSKPEFRTSSWIAMLFSAGMGIGMLFYGVAEPMTHFAKPPLGPGHTKESVGQAMEITFYHWGLHAWGTYVIIALALAYFAYRKKLPLSMRSVFYPILGERIHGPIGHMIDVLAVLCTLCGLATSLALGSMQINAGLHVVFGAPQSTTVQSLLIVAITICATISLVSGLEKGIKFLSEANMILGTLLMLFVFTVGPTNFLLDALCDNIANYLSGIMHRSFWRDSIRETGEWHQDWTIFYWGWWIAWSPFVGMFIARVSKGRTIREFIIGVLLIPTGVTFLWLTVFGDTAMYLELWGKGGISKAVTDDVSTAIYAVLRQLPFFSISAIMMTVVVATFFITSSDSASYVVDILTAGGNPHPPVWTRIFWALAEGMVAIVLLLVGGKTILKALQSAVISLGLPFCIVLLLMCYSLMKVMRTEKIPGFESASKDKQPESKDFSAPSTLPEPAADAIEEPSTST
jgi:choline/glycine/proline betaine transport protein